MCRGVSCAENLLHSRDLAVSVGDEGGFAPNLAGEEEAIQYILQAIQQAGYTPGRDFQLAIDAAASEWKSGTNGVYRLPKAKRELTTEQLICRWTELVENIRSAPLRIPWMKRIGTDGGS